MKRVMSKYRKIKTAVYDRDGGQCVICGNTNVEAHHVVFRSQGGKDEIGNLVCLCNKHHKMAHGTWGIQQPITQKRMKEILLKYLERFKGDEG